MAKSEKKSVSSKNDAKSKKAAVNGTKAVNSSPVKSTSVVNFFSQTPYMLIHNIEIGNKWKDFLVQEEGRKA